MTRINPKRIVIPDFFHPDHVHEVVGRRGKRPVSAEDNPKFLLLVNTFKKDGVLNPVPVRTDNGRIVLAHPVGYYRLMAAKEAGVRDVPTTGLEDAVEPEGA